MQTQIEVRGSSSRSVVVVVNGIEIQLRVTVREQRKKWFESDSPLGDVEKEEKLMTARSEESAEEWEERLVRLLLEVTKARVRDVMFV
jgi:hypothetical protein